MIKAFRGVHMKYKLQHEEKKKKETSHEWFWQNLSGDIAGFKLAVCNSQFGKHFDSLRMSFCVISKNCKSLKSDTS